MANKKAFDNKSKNKTKPYTNTSNNRTSRTSFDSEKTPRRRKGDEEYFRNPTNNENPSRRASNDKYSRKGSNEKPCRRKSNEEYSRRVDSNEKSSRRIMSDERRFRGENTNQLSVRERSRVRLDVGDGFLICGRNPISEALDNDREIKTIYAQRNLSGLDDILEEAKAKGVNVRFVEKEILDESANGIPHQGIVAVSAPYKYADLNYVLEEIEKISMENIDKLSKVSAPIDLNSGMSEQVDSGDSGDTNFPSSGTASEKNKRLPLLILLDGIEDPHNLGAIMRSAECAGASGVIIPKRHSASVNETVAKTSAGAIEYMPCVQVPNIASTIDKLKDNGFWIYACDMDGTDLYDAKLEGKVAIVIGNEGSGISRLVKEKCDFTISIPMNGRTESLNASNAAAIVMYDYLRQSKYR